LARSEGLINKRQSNKGFAHSNAVGNEDSTPTEEDGPRAIDCLTLEIGQIENLRRVRRRLIEKEVKNAKCSDLTAN
jgi:hypothetical protein